MPGTRVLAGSAILVIGLISVALPWSLGQGTAPPPVPAAASPPPATIPAAATVPAKPLRRDLSKLSLPARQAYLSAQRGADWLQRVNRPDGRFIHGYLPALRSNLEGDDYLFQAAAVHALARSARFYGDDKAAAIASQALLTLLLDTTVDAKDAETRYTNLPPLLVNRLAAAGMLVLAIHELPAPGKDLLDPGVQLCNFIRRQQQADGSLRGEGGGARGEAENPSDHGAALRAGPALYALMHSQQRTPATYKLDTLRKARGYYAAWWAAHKTPAIIPWHSAAYAEAYLATREAAFAQTVFEMNDWLCNLQHQQLNPRQPLWLGGFKNWRDGRESNDAPEIGSALYASSLAHACRVARQAGDSRRLERYRQAIEACGRFLGTLQYTEANTQHFAEWYRPVLVGAFHATHQDGNLRLDYTSQAVVALIDYLDHANEP